ncbi:MAG TPA: PHB depolymerase family esterase [Luteimonas sp.]|nr:PHB depolymerase family esterase [Luteimonas sp.]HRO26465.1 PHB depolymerase family esterase [Luteimonas sp.]HRP73419.1 PHB depolymerase family esterase [Luteimonas sp.]
MKRGWSKAVLLALLCMAGAAAQAQPFLTQVREFGSNPGTLRMFYYVPARLPADAPLVVVAHGCLGNAREIALTSGWVELADRFGIALLFPETSKQNEPWAGCFRTWEPAHQARDAGEPLSVRQMIGHMQALFPLDKSKTYMAGVSSGGHLTQVMMATYPEVFAATAVQSSFPYKCAMAASDLGPCAAAGREHSAVEWGDLVRGARPGYEGPWPRVQLWHGQQDTIMHYPNLQQLVLQWTNVHGIDAIADREDEILSNPRASYATADGDVRVEAVTVTAMGHAIAVDPGDGPTQCGTTAMFAADVDICAAYWISEFFGIAD